MLSLQPGTRGWNGTGTWRSGPRRQKQPGSGVEKAPLASYFPLFDPGMRLWHRRYPRPGLLGLQGRGGEEAEVGNNTEEKNSFLIINFSALECDMLIHCEASNLGDKGPDNTSCARLGWRSEPRQGGSI